MSTSREFPLVSEDVQRKKATGKIKGNKVEEVFAIEKGYLVDPQRDGLKAKCLLPGNPLISTKTKKKAAGKIKGAKLKLFMSLNEGTRSTPKKMDKKLNVHVQGISLKSPKTWKEKKLLAR